MYHRRGAATEVVAASMSLPVLFPPQLVDERVLVDGTLTDNCPTGPLVAVPEGPVVAVRIGMGRGDRRRVRVPSLGETLMRVMQAGDRSHDRDGDRGGGAPRATVTVTPDTRGIGLLEFHQIDRARDAGRQAGEAVVAALRERART